MRSILIFWVIGAFIATASGEQKLNTALNALKVLPENQAKLVARIEAREGTPQPERWYLLVHDKDEENGLKEYVVAAGALVATRNISQFAERLVAEEVVGNDSLKVDSDRVAKLVQQYALANNVGIVALNYRLYKEAPEAAPLWKVSGVDEAGTEVGSIVMTAGKGQVLTHHGFARKPAPALTPTPRPVRETRVARPVSPESRTRVKPEPAAAVPIEEAIPAPEPVEVEEA
nr:hypothetical protein [Verrucomicrobiota bacterium]